MSNIVKINTLEEAIELRDKNKLLGQFFMPNDVYHSHELRAINSSGLKKFRQSPRHYKTWTNEPPKVTPALRMGTMIHEAILEPDVYKNKYTLGPDVNLRTNAGKAEMEAFINANPGKEIITKEEKEKVDAIMEASQRHPYYESVFSNGFAELALFWEDEDTGVLCKAKLDYLKVLSKLLTDVKTTEDASEFDKSCANFDYHIPNAFYLDGCRIVLDLIPDFIYWVVEKTPPYGIRLLKLDGYSVGYGYEIYKKYIRQYADCLMLDKWPCYPYDVERVSLPAWKFK